MQKSKFFGWSLAGLLIVAAIAFSTFKLDSLSNLATILGDDPVVVTDGDNTPTPTPEPIPSNKATVLIKAPAKVKAGELVILSVETSNATAFTWQVVPATKDFLVIDEGRRAVFSHGASGSFMFIVAAAKGDTVDVKTHIVSVTGPTNVGPGTDLTAKVASWCVKIESPTKRDEALKLAQSFLSVSAVISTGMTPADIVEATKKSNQDALGSNINLWLPFLEGLQLELKAQAAAGQLADAEAHAKAWRAIGEALKTYAESL